MRKLLQQFKKIVFFDTKTTGLDPEKDQIIELAAALVTENGIELKIDAFCKLPEGEKIPEKIVELTHITDDMLADKGIDYREACRIFCNMLHSDSEVLLVAHLGWTFWASGPFYVLMCLHWSVCLLLVRSFSARRGRA